MPVPRLPLELYNLILHFAVSNGRERLHLRWTCTLFSQLLTPPVSWTTFPSPPHQKQYKTLRSLLNRILQLSTFRSRSSLPPPTHAPTLLLLGPGTFHEEDYVIIASSIEIVGQSREETIVHGGFLLRGMLRGLRGKRGAAAAAAEDNDGVIRLCCLTVMSSSEHGIKALGTCSTFMLHDVCIDQCAGSGVYVGRNVVGRCEDVIVSRCVQNGMYVDAGGRLTLEGGVTSVHGNCRELEDGGTLYDLVEENEWNLHFFGIKMSCISSRLFLVAPLSLDGCSRENTGGGDWGGEGRVVVVNGAEEEVVVYSGEEKEEASVFKT